MKPFWGVDVTVNRRNKRLNGEEFLVKTVSDAQCQRYGSVQEAADQLDNRAELPLLFILIQGLSGILAIAGTESIVKRCLDGISLAELYAQKAEFFWACGLCAAIWLLLTLIARKRRAAVLDSREGQDALTKLDDAVKAVYAEMGVPDDAVEADILSLTYALKQGEAVPKNVLPFPQPWANISARVFVADGCLGIADLESRFAIPLSALRRIRTVKKSIALTHWNKETPPEKEPYKLKVYDAKTIRVKPYYILEFEHNGETWGLYFPSYELQVFESLTGLAAQ